MKKLDKQVAVRLTEDIIKIAWNNIKIRAASKLGPSENFSEYIRNLIFEDFQRNKKYINKKINDLIS